MVVPIPLFAPLEQELLGQIKNNINLLKGLERDKESLVSGLARIEARIADILHNWRGEPGDATSRNDLAEMRALAQRIADCLELYLYQPRPKKLLSRRRFAKKMKKLNKSLQKLVERPPNAAEQVGSQPALHVDETPKGVANATRKLLELLNTTGTDPEMLMVIAVVGFSGSGKTTLANEVYKRTSREGDLGFPLRARINSAQYNNNQTELLLRKIIQEFWPNAVEATGQLSLWDLKTYIKEHLQGVRYLIVFDDMNVKDHWECIRTTFDAKAGASSRIIVTTRLRSIAYHCRDHGDGYVHEMRAIGDKASKNISGLLENYQYRKKLLEKCGGHPLALCSVKGHFRSCDGPTEPICEALCNNLGKFLHDARKDDTHDFTRLRGVLMDNLVSLGDSSARSCMLYLGIFPCDLPIKRTRVTRRWVAEGYEDSFKQFIERNIVQPTGIRRNSSKEWKLCKTLSILHEFVLHMSISHDFIMAIEDQKEDQAASIRNKETKKVRRNKETKKVRHIFVNARNITSSGSADLSCVRSLTISKEAGLGGAFSKFSKYKLLRVLDMEDCCDVNDKHVNDICNLWNLRYLSLGTNITNLRGKFVKNLELLQSLHLSKETVSELPVQVIGMPYLVHLIGKFKFIYDKDKDAHDLSRTSNLENIAGAVASGKDKGFLLDIMPHMSKLRKVKIWCSSDGNIQDLDTHLVQAIQLYSRCDMQRSLTIDFKGLTQDDMEKLQGKPGCKKFFEETNGIKYVSTLKLRGILSKIPQFLAVLSGLTTLCLSSSTIVTPHFLSTLSEAINLLNLKLVSDVISGNVVIKLGQFQKLESLCFEVTGSSAAELKIDIDWSTVLETGETVFALPNLVSLQLLCEVLPDPSAIQITHLRKLQEIELHHKLRGDARIPWEEAAWNHPNRPNVLPLESFDDADDAGTAIEEPAPNVLLPVSVNGGPAEIPHAGADDNGDNGSILNIPSRFLKKAASKLWNFFGIEQAQHCVKVAESGRGTVAMFDVR